MNESSRDDTMRTIASFHTNLRRSGELDWIDIGFVCEGLAFAQRPLREGNKNIREQYNLGPRGAFILNLLANGLLYPLELATALSCGRSLISAELARLTEAGLVTSRPGEIDRRRTELTLTALGDEALTRIRAETSQIIRANLAGYSSEEIRQFGAMLRAVRGESVLSEPLLLDEQETLG